MTSKQVAVFFDRDGTINEDFGYIDCIARFSLIPGAAAAIARLNQQGILTILLTNQSGVARGFFPESFVDELHQHLQTLLALEKARLDGIYYCPHHPSKMPCACRKPARGMINKALEAHHIDFSRSYVVGDKAIDMALAQEGAKGVLVQTGCEKDALPAMLRSGNRPDYVARDVSDAVEWILDDL